MTKSDLTTPTIIFSEANKLQMPPQDKFQLAHQYIQLSKAKKLIEAYLKAIQAQADTLFEPNEVINNYQWVYTPSTTTPYKKVLDALHDNLPDDLQVLATELTAQAKKPTISKYFKEI